MGWASGYIAALARGEIVSFRPRGNSMTPRIRSGQLCTVAPSDGSDASPGDVVLCTVRGAQYLHLVKATGDRGLLIGNAHGGTNGWTRRIHGKLISISE